MDEIRSPNPFRLVVYIPLFARYCTSQVVQDFFHQHYFGDHCPNMWSCASVHLARSELLLSFLCLSLHSISSCCWIATVHIFLMRPSVPLWIVLHQELSYKTGPYGVISPVKMALQIGFTGIISPRNKWSYWMLTYNWWLWAYLVPAFPFWSTISLSGPLGRNSHIERRRHSCLTLNVSFINLW